MVQLFDQMVRLPWTTFVWFMSRMAEIVNELPQLVGNQGPAPRAPLGLVRKEETQQGTGEKETGADLKKERTMNENYSWNNDEKKVRLFEYTIVTIRRGGEEILEHGQELVKDPMEECDFNSWVILKYAAKHNISPDDRKYLRVWSRELKSWDKQPLHYEERQLAFLHEISSKIGPTV